jgi:hypothetical protein
LFDERAFSAADPDARKEKTSARMAEGSCMVKFDASKDVG